MAATLEASPDLPALSDRDRRSLGDSAFTRFATLALNDDILTVDEEDALIGLADALGIDQEAVAKRHLPIMHRLVVARVNDGRLPEVTDPHLLTKKGEVVHLETAATLIKEVAVREYRGGYSGVSIRIAKGVRYNTGATRGRSVVVGTKLEAADVGVLSVTSTRAVYVGTSRTTEFAYSKLVSLDAFTDGLRFHVTNRQNASLFRLESGDVVVATINAAMQRLDS